MKKPEWFIEKTVKEIIAMQLFPCKEMEHITRSANLVTDLGVDDYDIVKIISSLEAEFKIKLDEVSWVKADKFSDKHKTVNDIINLVKNKVPTAKEKIRKKSHIYANDKEKIGTVSWFDRLCNYGFIETDDGGDYFVHHANTLTKNRRPLKRGQEVYFEIEHHNGVMRANHVIPVKFKVKIQNHLKEMNEKRLKEHESIEKNIPIDGTVEFHSKEKTLMSLQLMEVKLLFFWTLMI